MSRRSLLAALAGILFAAPLLLGATAGGPRPVLEIMLDLSRRHAAAEKELLDGRLDDELKSSLAALAGIYGELQGSYRPFYGGSAQAWAAMCEKSRAAAEEAGKAAEKGDLAGTRAAFYRLAKIREEAHEEFRPGFLKRLIRIFRRKPANN